MARKSIVRGEGTTRKRILEAASQRFASTTYEATSLRDIAADVGVDVAYVHRSFGSKESLFLEVLQFSESDIDIAGTDSADLPAVLAQRLFTRPSTSPNEADPLAILVYSFFAPAAGKHVSDRLLSEFIQPIQEKLGDQSPTRSTAIMSMLIGMSMLKNMLHLPSLNGSDSTETEAQVVEALTAIMTNPYLEKLQGDPNRD